MKKSVKIIIEALLLVVIAGLVLAIYSSIMKPVNFNKQRSYRESVAIQRLKDIRTLETAYKAEYNKYSADYDSLTAFYENGKMSILMQIGSADDSLAWDHTEKVKKTIKAKAKDEINKALYEMYLNGDKNLVFSVTTKIPVKDTLFLNREDFCIDSLWTIPFSGGQPILMDTLVKQVSGVPVPLFEAKMPFKTLLKGMDNQLRINLDAERRDQNKYEGLQVGSISAPNNNAGNWE